MLPIDPSPSKVKVVKDLRVAEWIRDSVSGVKVHDNVKPAQRSCNPKRKMTFSNENYPTLASASKKQKLENSVARQPRQENSSKPMSPRKFYVPNGDSQQKVSP